MAANPLLDELRLLLHSPGQVFSEHALIKHLVGCGLLPENFNTRPVLLFQAHFALFNALYQLQDELVEEGCRLAIGLVDIQVLPMVSAAAAREQALGSAREAKLRAYYLNWQHFDSADDASVEALLDDFWQNLGRTPLPDADKQAALAEFELIEPVTFAEVKKRYRRLAMAAHPDRGGDTAELQRINQAMSVLTRAYNKHR